MTQLFRAGMIGARMQAPDRSGEGGTMVRRALAGDTRSAPRTSLFEGMMSDFQDAFDSFNYFNPFTIARPERPATPRGSFTEMRFAGPDGSRSYKLYVPACAEAGVALPLVVMLHGCTQSPDDFAAGTRMNDWAERDGFLVCYPAQTSSANGQRCWNWFKDDDQKRGAGEPALIAGITRDVMARWPIDPDRIYVAGLSAGGALAATMGQRYPDLYAAVGIHSGLACGAAHDVNSAFAAMRAGAGPHVADSGTAPVPAIVFHGDRDSTVHPVNADEVAAQAVHAAPVEVTSEEGSVPGGRAYKRTLHRDPRGRVLVEQWTVHGAGHAWSGGSATGSYTDPQGPDASGEMLRFFAEHVGATAPVSSSPA